jgi:hypothetical protein
MTSLVRGLTWPIITLLIVGGTHLVAEMLRPQLQDLISPAVVMPIHLVAGGWAGYATVRAGGTFVHGLVAGAILGLLPVALQLVGFGLILGRHADVTMSLALFGLFTIFWGGALGAGIAASRDAFSEKAASRV